MFRQFYDWFIVAALEQRSLHIGESRYLALLRDKFWDSIIAMEQRVGNINLAQVHTVRTTVSGPRRCLIFC